MAAKKRGRIDRYTLSCLFVPQVLFFDYATLFDTGFLAGELAEVVQFGTAYFTVFVDGDRVDKRRFDGEDTLNTDVVAHLADGETFLAAFATDADNNAAILLDTLFVTFFDAVSHGDCVAGAEVRVLFAGGKCFFGNLNQVHFVVF